MREIIHIYHTNDLHSHFENWPRIEAFLKERKALHEAAGETVFLFDIGDFADRWHPFTEGSLGKSNTKLLNNVGYTAATIGNNEGITLPHEALAHLYEEAEFDMIVANLYEPGQKRPQWLVPYKIYETKTGIKIGVTAVTTFYEKLYELLGWELTEPFAELEIQINRMKDEVDIVILLSHLGIHEDEKITELFPEIDLIIGAHTHHYFPEGQQIGNTLLAAAGKYGYYTGYVKVTVDYDLSLQMDARLFPTESLSPVPKEDKVIAEFHQIGKKQLDVPVAEIQQSLDFSWEQPSELSKLLCEAIYEWCDGDCAMINSGLILSRLEKGTVTKYDLHQMLPHPINPCTIELTGAELKEIVLHAKEDGWSDFPVIGLGFRGKVMGVFQFHGIEVNKEKLEVKVNGKMIDPDQTYKLATVDMFTFGKFFPEIQRSEKKHYFMPEFLRDVMAWKLRNASI